MSDIPSNLRYTNEHEWVRREGDVVVVGITDHAAKQLGDIVFVELPDDGRTVAPGEGLGTLESVKAVAEFYAPVSGTIAGTNAEINDSPENINTDPYGSGWLVKIKPSDLEELDAFMDAAKYRAYLQEQE
jgi:glycine cleavage system H protein